MGTFNDPCIGFLNFQGPVVHVVLMSIDLLRKVQRELVANFAGSQRLCLNVQATVVHCVAFFSAGFECLKWSIRVNPNSGG